MKPCLDTQRLVYIGLRDIDDGEKKIIKEKNIKAFSMHHVDKYGIGKVVDMALDHVHPGRNRPIHLSFDVDALDPSVAPSTVSLFNHLEPRTPLPHVFFSTTPLLKRNQPTLVFLFFF